MVSKKGIVAFVDCDSFQVAEGRRIFRCGVGVPEYTPPELHGKNFASLDRAANHDLFGLAVLIFHLLMMGRHPFSGVPLSKADIPIEKAIQDGCYAYTRNTAKARLRPPPQVPPATMLDPAMLALFERAFGTSRRPTAAEWRTSLDVAMKQLLRCKNDPKHSYLAAAGKCPWCELITVARLMFFLPGQGQPRWPSGRRTSRSSSRSSLGCALLRPLYAAEAVAGAGVAPRGAALGEEAVTRGLTRPRPLRVQKPPLAPLPLAPTLLFKPSLIPLPSQPHPVRRPPLTPHPAAPHVQRPALTPHPPAPPDPPLPKLKPMPAAPAHPKPPQLGSPDTFLPRLSVAGMIAGFLIIFIAEPVGIIMVELFAAWWGLMRITHIRRERLLAALKRDHRFECERIDEEYAELCRPVEEANQRRMADWQAAKAALAQEHGQDCKKVDDMNARQLAAFEAAEAACRAGHDRECREIDARNNRLLAAWQATNAAHMAEYVRKRDEIEAKNRLALTEWEAENCAARRTTSERVRRSKQRISD